MKSKLLPSLSTKAADRAGSGFLANSYLVPGRGDAVDHDLQIATAGFHVRGNIDMGIRGTDVAHCHRAVIMRSAIENVARARVGNSHNRIIGRSLGVVAVVIGLGSAVEFETGQRDRTTTPNDRRADQGRRCDARVRIPRWRVDLDISAAISVEHLSGGQ